MARLVRIRRIGPYRVETSDGILFICGCGLSRDMPYCDNSHKACWGEDPDKLYVYDERLRAAEVGEDDPNAPGHE